MTNSTPARSKATARPAVKPAQTKRGAGGAAAADPGAGSAKAGNPKAGNPKSGDAAAGSRRPTGQKVRTTPTSANPAPPAAKGVRTSDDVATVTTSGAKVRSYTPSKKELGVATPKRRTGGRLAEPPPTNRREAAKRMREKQRTDRAEQRAGMMAGKDEFLLKRDRGPEKALVRDIVDSRRNVAGYFLPGALIIILGTSAAMPAQVRLAANILWFLLAVGVIVDSFIVSRRIRRLVTERFPKSPLSPRSYYWYAIVRSLSFRKMRMPAPRVPLGAKI